MRRKIIISSVLAAAAVALLVGVLAVPAWGGSGSAKNATTKSSSSLSPLGLVAKVARALPGTQAVYGQFTWTNNVLGPSFQLPSEAPAVLKSLWAGGSGEFWYQGGKFRLEVANGADKLTIVENGKSAWVYDTLSNTATKYALPARSGHREDLKRLAKPMMSAGNRGFSMDSAHNLAMLMSAVNLSVTQQQVAGQTADVLTITPTAPNTTLGSINIAFDDTTFVPLSVSVLAKDSSTVLNAAVTSIDYQAVAAGEFRFAPPAGAKIVHEKLRADTQEARHGRCAAREGMVGVNGRAKLMAMTKDLTLVQAKAKVGFPLLSLTSPMADLPFQAANVVSHKKPGPFAILRYGQGFGTVVLVEGKLTAAQQTQVLGALNVTGLGTQATINGNQGTEVSTPLVHAFIWTTSGVFHVAAGAVSETDLAAFVTGLS